MNYWTEPSRRRGTAMFYCRILPLFLDPSQKQQTTFQFTRGWSYAELVRATSDGLAVRWTRQKLLTHTGADTDPRCSTCILKHHLWWKIKHLNTGRQSEFSVWPKDSLAGWLQIQKSNSLWEKTDRFLPKQPFWWKQLIEIEDQFHFGGLRRLSHSACASRLTGRALLHETGPF